MDCNHANTTTETHEESTGKTPLGVGAIFCDDCGDVVEVL